ncbi:hypothetical protein [Nostoc sp. MG11]|nr:hypothetical protein [Nostoc sp. MG11]
MSSLREVAPTSVRLWRSRRVVGAPRQFAQATGSTFRCLEKFLRLGKPLT